MAKYIRVASDLHLEQFYGKDIYAVEVHILPHDPRDEDSILVLAGDISSKPDQLCMFLKCIEPRFQHIVYVPGNHEYYRHDMAVLNNNVSEHLKQHFTKVSAALGEVKCFDIDGIRFICGTYWSDGGETPLDRFNVSRGLWDFEIISNLGEKFTVEDMVDLHKTMKSDVQAFLEMPTDKLKVVVTHHMPSYRLCHPRFGNDINGGFASKSDNLLVGENSPDIWIHGHTHDTIDMALFDTRIVCNPRGYIRETNASAHNSYGAKFIEA